MEQYCLSITLALYSWYSITEDQMYTQIDYMVDFQYHC